MEQYPLRSELRPDTDLDPPRRRRLRAAESERTLSSGPPGDLYVYLDIEEIPEIQRDGINLNSSISVSYLDAILGTVMKGINLRETLIGKLNSPLGFLTSVAIGKSEQVPLAPEAPMEQYPLQSELRPDTDLDPPRRRRLRAAESERTLSSVLDGVGEFDGTEVKRPLDGGWNRGKMRNKSVDERQPSTFPSATQVLTLGVPSNRARGAADIHLTGLGRVKSQWSLRKVCLQKLQWSQNYNPEAYEDLTRFVETHSLEDGDKFCADLMHESPRHKSLEVRYAYCKIDFEWDNLQRLASKMVEDSKQKLTGGRFLQLIATLL
ncbi:hypothetical protein CASFOL_018872 [Castilleja foliolosa]|uniref:Chaperone DnaJ C-terminal domain-containing protein n=1 Tax=Castilleja foliolosa TaxID=1961234 RepID=A0ABD3D3I5_9LAMI